MNKSHNIPGLPVICLDVLLPIPPPSKLGHYHLTSLPYLILLNHRSLSFPLLVCQRLPLGLRLSSLYLCLVTLRVYLWRVPLRIRRLFSLSFLRKPHSPDLSCFGSQRPNVEVRTEHWLSLSISAITILILLGAAWLLPNGQEKGQVIKRKTQRLIYFNEYIILMCFENSNEIFGQEGKILLHLCMPNSSCTG